MKKFQKLLLSLLLISIFSFVSGCDIKLPSIFDDVYEVDATIYENGVKYRNLDLSKLKIIINEEEEISVDATMISAEDLELLKTPGTHTIDINYNDQVLKVTIKILPDDAPSIDGDLKIIYTNIGQADCIIIKLPNNETFMIDCGVGYSGSFSIIDSVLQEENITVINHLLITHNHADHYAAVPDLLDNYPVENVYASGTSRTNKQYLEIISAIEAKDLEIYTMSVGDKILDYPDLVMQVVATQITSASADPNISSVMVKLTYKNTSYMFTGDGGCSSKKDAEYIALASGINLESDVLKVGHHGSKEASSADFLAAVKPKYAILTTEDDSKDGLPTTEALDRIKVHTTAIYETRIYGEVVVISDGETIQITTEREV